MMTAAADPKFLDHQAANGDRLSACNVVPDNTCQRHARRWLDGMECGECGGVFVQPHSAGARRARER